MANTKGIKALKGLSKDELVSKARELEQNLFNNRMKLRTGQLENTSSLWAMRKELARVKTLQGQAAAKTAEKPAKAAK